LIDFDKSLTHAQVMSATRRKDGRRGAVVVESALTLLPLLAVSLAILDLAFVLFLRSTFQHAVREGVRYAVTSRTAPGSGHDASIRSVVQRHAIGFLNEEESAEKIKIRYFVPGSLAETGSNAGGNIVEVSIEGFEWSWIVPLFHSALPVRLTMRASDRMEPSPGGVPPPR
jgi:hypothetical protein